MCVWWRVGGCVGVFAVHRCMVGVVFFWCACK